MAEQAYESSKTVTESGPVVVHARRLNEGLEELSRRLHVLRSKSAPVRNESPKAIPSSDKEMKDFYGGSPLFQELDTAVDAVHRMQNFVSELTDELEV